MAEKRPEFVVDADFDFERFSRRPTVALAQSLFTHLNAADVGRCLARLRDVADGPFYATFHRCAAPRDNPAASHPHGRFDYTAEELAAIGEQTGWRMDLIGQWGHPRRQEMARFRIR